jgi:hypothetical protein
MGKNAVWILLSSALFFGAAIAGAFDRSDFDRIVDFSMTLKGLDQGSGGSRADLVQQGKLLILNGTVSNIRILSPEPEGFQVQLELVLGEWIGLEEVRSYRCSVLFQGPEYAPLFPRKKSGVSGAAIETNTRVLVVARALEPVSVEKDRTDWLLQGFHIRSLQ